mmetsp:Transcript_1848/g.4567  ORF Transcript_1848/g.4567 Transcript_1848/m.4567 type:complete len:344 (+) Transcript_1848:254-1285(+)
MHGMGDRLLLLVRMLVLRWVVLVHAVVGHPLVVCSCTLVVLVVRLPRNSLSNHLLLRCPHTRCLCRWGWHSWVRLLLLQRSAAHAKHLLWGNSQGVLWLLRCSHDLGCSRRALGLLVHPVTEIRNVITGKRGLFLLLVPPSHEQVGDDFPLCGLVGVPTHLNDDATDVYLWWHVLAASVLALNIGNYGLPCGERFHGDHGTTHAAVLVDLTMRSLCVNGLLSKSCRPPRTPNLLSPRDLGLGYLRLHFMHRLDACSGHAEIHFAAFLSALPHVLTAFATLTTSLATAFVALATAGITFAIVPTSVSFATLSTFLLLLGSGWLGIFAGLASLCSATTRGLALAI